MHIYDLIIENYYFFTEKKNILLRIFYTFVRIVFCDLNIVLSLSLSLSSQLAGQMVFFLHSKYVEIAGNINIKPPLMHTCHQL